MSPIRVLLADDHPVMRSGLRHLLEKSGEIEVVGEAATGAEALELAGSRAPDLLLLDMELPDLQGTQVARQVQQRHPQVKILALSAHADPLYIRGVLEAGAAGYLLKDEAPEMILEAIRGVARGDQGWVSRAIAAQMSAWVVSGPSGRAAGGQPGAPHLTRREEEVLRLVVAGKTNQAIALELAIHEKTVEKYMGSIFSKLNVNSRVEAAVHAVRTGLVKQG